MDEWRMRAPATRGRLCSVISLDRDWKPWVGLVRRVGEDRGCGDRRFLNGIVMRVFRVLSSLFSSSSILFTPFPSVLFLSPHFPTHPHPRHPNPKHTYTHASIHLTEHTLSVSLHLFSTHTTRIP